MKFPYEVISGELLLDSLFNENLITQGQHDRISKHYEDSRNENNFTLILISEILEFIDESQHDDVINLIKTKGQVKLLTYCYVAI